MKKRRSRSIVLNYEKIPASGLAHSPIVDSIDSLARDSTSVSGFLGGYHLEPGQPDLSCQIDLSAFSSMGNTRRGFGKGRIHGRGCDTRSMGGNELYQQIEKLFLVKTFATDKVVTYYLCVIKDGVFQPSDEVSEYGYFSRDHLPDIREGDDELIDEIYEMMGRREHELA